MHTTATAIPPAVDEGCATPEQPEVLRFFRAHWHLWVAVVVVLVTGAFMGWLLQQPDAIHFLD